MHYDPPTQHIPAQAQQAQHAASYSTEMERPLAVINPIPITPGVLKWLVGAIASVFMFLAASPVAERYLNPAKQSDLEAVSVLVKVLQDGQKAVAAAQQEQRAALERLTLAVDNLSGIVDGVKQAAASVPAQLPVRAPRPAQRR